MGWDTVCQGLYQPNPKPQGGAGWRSEMGIPGRSLKEEWGRKPGVGLNTWVLGEEEGLGDRKSVV